MTKRKLQEVGPDLEAVPASVIAKKRKTPKEEPITAKERSFHETDKELATSHSDKSKKRKLVKEPESSAAAQEPAVDSNQRAGRSSQSSGMLSTRDLGLYSNYTYEFEGLPVEQVQWSWGYPSKFRNPTKIAKMQALFNKEDPKGTRGLKPGTVDCEEACRKHAVVPPPGAPAIPLKDQNGEIHAWFGPGGFTSDRDSASSPVVLSATKPRRKTSTKKDSLSPMTTSVAEVIGEPDKTKTSSASTKAPASRRKALMRKAKDGPSPLHSSADATASEPVLKENRPSPANSTVTKTTREPAKKKVKLGKVIKNSPALHRVPLRRHPSTQKRIVGLYSRQLNRLRSRRGNNAVYTPIHTRDRHQSVHKHQEPWYENPSKNMEVYLMEWEETRADGSDEKIRGFVQAEDLDKHVGYRPIVEEFENEASEAEGERRKIARKLKKAQEEAVRLKKEENYRRKEEAKKEKEKERLEDGAEAKKVPLGEEPQSRTGRVTRSSTATAKA